MKKFLLILLILFISAPCFANTYNVFYPKSLKNVRIWLTLSYTTWAANVSGTLNGNPVTYVTDRPSGAILFPVTLIGVPTNANHAWIKKVD